MYIIALVRPHLLYDVQATAMVDQICRLQQQVMSSALSRLPLFLRLFFSRRCRGVSTFQLIYLPLAACLPA